MPKKRKREEGDDEETFYEYSPYIAEQVYLTYTVGLKNAREHFPDFYNQFGRVFLDLKHCDFQPGTAMDTVKAVLGRVGYPSDKLTGMNRCS